MRIQHLWWKAQSQARCLTCLTRSNFSVAKEDWNFGKATLWNELGECEQQCTSVQQAFTSLQFQLLDAQGREKGLTMELEQLLLAEEDWVHKRKKLEEELETLG